MPMPIPLPMQAMTLPAGAMPAPAPVMSLHPLRQASPQVVAMGVAEVLPETAPMMEAMPTAAPQPIQHPPAAPEPRVAPAASRGGLFAEAPRPVSAAAPAAGATTEARPSLFSTVTGAFRRRQPASVAEAAPAPVRAEPAMQDPRPEPPRASVRQTGGDEVGLDIPAFLRRQSS
jgi:cell division protein FtsZ